MTHPFGKTVESLKRLREILPSPPEDALSVMKVANFIDDNARLFIAHSPYALISTSNRSGSCEASPRGGNPGFVKVLDEHHLLIAEASGNRRADSMVNLLENPKIGMLFLIPGYDETLRIKGQAFITEELPLLKDCEFVNGYAPLLGLGIRVEECHLHCAKASMRSSLWNPMGWPDLSLVPGAAKILMGHAASRNSVRDIKDVQLALNDSYVNRL